MFGRFIRDAYQGKRNKIMNEKDKSQKIVFEILKYGINLSCIELWKLQKIKRVLIL